MRVVVVHDYRADGSIARHRYASTALTLDGGEVVHRYQSRFAQEFLFRDAKQELGLEHCQAYSWEKIDFHLNAALTVGSLAKAAHHLCDEETRGKPFSIADIKTLYVNELQCARILSLCGSTRTAQQFASCGQRSGASDFERLEFTTDHCHSRGVTRKWLTPRTR